MLPKQLMHYADRHFHENQQLYSDISTLASQLLSQSKRYPHPLLLYKTLLYTHTNSTLEKSSPITKTPIAKETIQENVTSSPSVSIPVKAKEDSSKENKRVDSTNASSDL